MGHSLEWGLGIEHEMLFGTTPNKDGSTRALDSTKVAHVVIDAWVNEAYNAVEAALGKKFMRPVREATLTLGKGGHGRALFPAHKVGRLNGVSVKHLRIFLECEYPFVFDDQRSLNVWRRMLCVPPNAWGLVNDVSLAMKPAFATFQAQCNPANVRALARHLMEPSVATVRFGEAIIVAVEQVMSGSMQTKAELRIGSVLRIFDHAYDSVVLHQGKGAPVTSKALAEAIVAVPMKPSMWKNGQALEVDGDFVEVKTLRFANVQMEALVAELQRHEALGLAAARTLDPSAHILPHSGYDSINGSTVPMYAGSYHFWFTLPHSPRSSGPDGEEKDFMAAHAAFAHRLQWLEPLLLACSGGDPRAIGAGTAHPRANIRGTLNEMAGPGVVDVCGPSFGTSPITGVVPVYASTNAFLQKEAPSWASGSHSITYRDSNGRVRPFLACHNTKRGSWNFSDGSNSSFALDLTTSSINRMLSETTQLAEGGNDIRTEWCGNFERAMAPGWIAFLVTGGRGLEVRFAKKGTKTIRDRFPSSASASASHHPRAHLTGFEFRVMDNMPSSALMPLLRLFVLVAAASDVQRQSTTTTGCPDTGAAQNDPVWASAAAAVIAGGQFARVPSAYVRTLRRTLGLKAESINRSAKSEVACEVAWEALTRVCQDAHEQYGDHPWVHLLLKKKYDAPPVLAQTNLAAWRDAFALKFGSKVPKAAVTSKAWELDRPFLAALQS